MWPWLSFGLRGKRRSPEDRESVLQSQLGAEVADDLTARTPEQGRCLVLPLLQLWLCWGGPVPLSSLSCHLCSTDGFRSYQGPKRWPGKHPWEAWHTFFPTEWTIPRPCLARSVQLGLEIPLGNPRGAAGFPLHIAAGNSPQCTALSARLSAWNNAMKRDKLGSQSSASPAARRINTLFHLEIERISGEEPSLPWMT